MSGATKHDPDDAKSDKMGALGGRPPARGAARVAAAAVAALSWMAVSSLLILLNKYIMVDLGFKYPMTVSGMGMFASGVLSYLACHVFNLVECQQPVSRQVFMGRIMPVGLLMASTLFTGNQVYLYLTVSFIQMLKAFTPVITMIMLFLARLEEPSGAMVWSVLLTAMGTALAAYGEVNLSWLGLFCMFSSEATEAGRLVLTQSLLVGFKFHPIEGLMYMAPACCAWLGLGALLFEVPRMQEAGAGAIASENVGLFLAAACMGFAVNTLAYTTIKLASSLTLKVLATVKNALLVVVGAVFLGETVTGVQGVGYAISLAGFGWYNQIKMRQISGGGGA